MSTLGELTTRVEGATEGSWELDAEIAWVCLEQDWSSGPERAVSEPFPHIERLSAYTASLDAALALCERVLPGWTIAKIGQDDNGMWGTVLREVVETTTHRRVQTAWSIPTPALALILAMLRALASTPEGEPS